MDDPHKKTVEVEHTAYRDNPYGCGGVPYGCGGVPNRCGGGPYKTK